MSRSKYILILSLCLSVLPLTASADPTPKPVANEAAREMTPAMMAKAFKNFSAVLDQKSKTVVLKGVQSPECMDLFTVANSPDDASFRISFKGGPASCLSHTNLKCAAVGIGQSNCAKLSEKEGAEMDLGAMSEDAAKDAEDKKIVIVAKKLFDPYSDIANEDSDEEKSEQIRGYDRKLKTSTLLSYTSPEVLKAKEEERLEKLAKKKMELCNKFMADCRGLPEAWKAIEYAEEHDTDEDHGDDYIDGLKLAQNKAELAKKIKKLATIRSSDRESIDALKAEILELANQDERLKDDVAKVFKAIAKQELTDPSSLTKEARARQLATLEDMKGLLSESEFKAYQTDLDKTYLARSLMEGAKSENFQDAYKLQMAPFKEKLLAEGCINEAGAEVVNQKCLQLAALIKADPAYKELQMVGQNATLLQNQIDTRLLCEQGKGTKEQCSALLQSQNLVDPSAANPSLIPNPFAPTAAQTVANAAAPQNGVIATTNVLNNQPATTNPFLQGIQVQNPFATQVDPNLSVFTGKQTLTQTTAPMNTGTQQQVIQNKIAAQPVGLSWGPR